MPVIAANQRSIRLMPSILAADFARLGEQAREVAAAGADQVDSPDLETSYSANSAGRIMLAG